MKIALIGYVWPEPTSSAAGCRTLQVLQAFRARNWETHLLSASSETPASDSGARLGVTAHAIQLNHASFDRTIEQLAPDCVIFDRFVTEEQFGARVREHAPQAIRVIDTQDLHFVRRGREALLRAGAPADAILGCEFAFTNDDAIREISAIYRSDLSLVLSSFEMELLRSRCRVPSELLQLSRFQYPAVPERPAFTARSHFAFLGNFRHPPNADAVTYLKMDIWPAIRRELPEAEVHVYGAYPSREMMALSDPPSGFKVLGPAGDAIETLGRYRVLLAPLRFGAGIKGKITDAWYAGTPCVSTLIGAEGMRGENGDFGGLIAGSVEEWKTAATRLYGNSDEWRAAQTRGKEILAQCFNETLERESLINSIAQAHAMKDARRQANLVGAMLWHHSHRSTEFFSRWIELKNAL